MTNLTCHQNFYSAVQEVSDVIRGLKLEAQPQASSQAELTNPVRVSRGHSSPSHHVYLNLAL